MNGRQVFVFENEDVVALDLEACLVNLGYTVAVARVGEEAVSKVNRFQPDVVLIAAESIRSETGIPLIFLAADASQNTIGRAPAADPAGYLVIPFNENSLAASIRLALQRNHGLGMTPEPSPSPEAKPQEVAWTKIGNLRIDGVRHRVFRGDYEIKLTRKEFRILQCLTEQPGVPVSPEALLAKAWGPQFVHYIQALRVHVGHLRQKITGQPSAGVRIETIRGVGYCLVGLDCQI